MPVDVYISPSTQPHNAVVGGGTEQSVQYVIGVLLAAALRRCGVTCHLSQWRLEGQFVNAGLESDRLGARYHHALHSDASATASTNYTHSIVAPGASEAARVARIIQDELTSATGWPSRGVVERDDLYELTQTNAHAVLTEAGFHTNPTQAAFLRQQPGVIAEAYARAWCRALGRTYVPLTGASATPEQENDMTPEQAAQLARIEAVLAQVSSRVNDRDPAGIQAKVQVMANANAERLVRIEKTLASLTEKVDRLGKGEAA